MSSIILRIITRCDTEGVLCCRPLHTIPQAGHSTVSRSPRRSRAILDSAWLEKRLWWHIRPYHTGEAPLLTYEAMHYCRVSHIGVLDGSALCRIEPVVFAKHVRQFSLQAVCSRAESPGVLEGMVLYKTPSWGTMPLQVVEYPISAYWMAYCRTGPLDRGTRWGHAR